MPETCYTAHPQWPIWLAAVSANPDDDNVRKACAEWLYDLETEPATARADFISRQCDYAEKKVLRGRETDEQWLTVVALCEAVETGDWVPAEFGDGVPFFKTRPLDCGTVMVEYENPEGGPNPWLGYARGFLSWVCGPLAVLHGDQCPYCGGQGSSYFHPSWTPSDCKRCDATGRLDSVLRPLLAREPLSADGVRVFDRAPHYNHSHFWFRDDQSLEPTDSIPSDLYPFVIGGWGEYRDGVAYYRTAEEAYRCLGRGLHRFHLRERDPRHPAAQPPEPSCPPSGS